MFGYFCEVSDGRFAKKDSAPCRLQDLQGCDESTLIQPSRSGHYASSCLSLKAQCSGDCALSVPTRVPGPLQTGTASGSGLSLREAFLCSCIFMANGAYDDFAATRVI
jgi:hypothetical protein